MTSFRRAVLLAALASLILPSLAGAAPRRDRTAPETTITAVSTTDTNASFSFSANETATFECKLDAGSYAGCTSPKTYSGLSAGSHTFSVRAKDGSRNVDQTPATHTWQITSSAPPPPPPPSDSPPPSGSCDISPANGQAAITAAIEGCPNGSTVRFPAGASYTLTDEIVVKDRSDLVIDGNGSTFTTTTPNDSPAFGSGVFDPNWLLLRDTRVTLKNMTVVGNFRDTGPRRIIDGNQFNPGVLVAGGNTVNVLDVTANDIWGDMAMVTKTGTLTGDVTAGDTPTNVRIQRLKGTRAARQCVAITAAEGVWLEDSTISNCYIAAIDVEMDWDNVPLRDVHILRNTISDYFLSAITVPQFSTAGNVRNIEIRGNKTLTAPDACWPTIDIKDERYARNAGGQTAENIVTEDNDIKTKQDGVNYHDVTSGSVRNNRIELTGSLYYCGGTADPAKAVDLVSSPNVGVSGNTLVGF